MMMCKNGFRVDNNGCELCECVDQGQVRCPQVSTQVFMVTGWIV